MQEEITEILEKKMRLSSKQEVMEKAQKMEEGCSVWLSKIRTACWEVIESDLSEVSMHDFERWISFLKPLARETRDLAMFLDSCETIFQQGIENQVEP